MRKVYDLREDVEQIALMQRATLAPQAFGVVSDHGLVGSPDWWAAIADGRIPMHAVEGRISRIYKSGLPSPDWEEFEIEADGEVSSWTRMTSGGAGGDAERVAKGALYQVGRAVRITYVKLRFRQALQGLPFSKRVLEIWIDDRPAGAPQREPNERDADEQTDDNVERTD